MTLPWVLWAAAFAVSEVLVVHVQWQREAHTFSVSDLVLAAGLVLAVPHDLVLAQVVGTGAALVVHRRQRGSSWRSTSRSSRWAPALRVVFALLVRPARAGDWLGGAGRHRRRHGDRRPVHLRRHEPVRGPRGPGSP